LNGTQFNLSLCEFGLVPIDDDDDYIIDTLPLTLAIPGPQVSLTMYSILILHLIVGDILQDGDEQQISPFIPAKEY
jgi:hypothetical protein